MTRLIEAEKLERYYRDLEAASEELAEANRNGLAWMAANNYHLPPIEMQQRLERALEAWNAIRKRGPFGDLPVRNQVPARSRKTSWEQ